MAAAEWKSNAALIEHVQSHAKHYGFFAAVTLLTRIQPGTNPVGETGLPTEEAIRFEHNDELVFHTSDVESVRFEDLRNGRRRAVLKANFLGLIGSSGPLATYMSEDILRGDEKEAETLRAFYGIFHHRLLSLYFRAWRKYRLSAGFRADATDSFTIRALAFVGIDMKGALPRAGLPASDLLALAPLLGQRTRTSRMLQIVLERVFEGADVRIINFLARRVTIEADQRVALGQKNNVLGMDLVVGRTVIDRSGGFRVVIGPVSYEAFESFVPGGRNHVRLRKIIEQFTGGMLEPQIELKLDDQGTPRFQLGVGRGSALGVTTQLVTTRKRPMRVRITLSENAEQAATQIVPDDEPEDDVDGEAA